MLDKLTNKLTDMLTDGDLDIHVPETSELKTNQNKLKL